MHHWVNGSLNQWGHWWMRPLGEWVIEWMGALVNESLGEWVIEWIGALVNESLGEWVIESMRVLVNEAIGWMSPLGEWGHCYIWKDSVRCIDLIQVANRHKALYHKSVAATSSHMWAGVLACCMLQSLPLSLFAEQHMVNGGIGWMSLWVNGSLNEWGHW